MRVTVHDTTRCLLGEGPLWHPGRKEFFWCDILSRRVLSRAGGALRDWSFDRFVSCLGWVDDERVVVATETDLTLLTLEDGTTESLCALEADNPRNRSNDGRADPAGGFWVSTMGIGKEKGAGAIYRYYRGELTEIRGGLSIPNAICFTPDGRHAHFADTPTQVVMRWEIDAEGWPVGEPERFVDETADGHRPDGAVVDAGGRLWVSHWGSSRVAVYDAAGRFERQVTLPATQVTCPAFGGDELSTLYCTSAAVGLPEDELTYAPAHGLTFAVTGAGTGQAEHRVVL
jgi:sugar lactone lactonase YvrE